MKEESLSISQKESKVKKILSSPMFLAGGINLFFFLLIVFSCDMKYEVSDDFIMASIMSGAYGDAPNPQMIFVNVIIGYLLLPLYYLFPQISWYFVAEVFLIFVSSTTVTYVLFEKLEKEKAFMLSVLLILFFSNDAYILVQFTKTAMFAVMAGAMLFLWALFEKKSIWKMIFGGLLCLIGTMVRFSTIYLAGGFILFILGYEFWKLYVKKDSSAKGWKYPLLTIVLSGCLVIGAAYGCKWIDWYTYNNDEAYGFFTAYNSARADVVDASNYGYEAYAEDLKSVGISENDYYMMRNWTLADNDFFTIEKLQQTADAISTYQEQQDVTFDVIMERLRERNYPGMPVFFACALLLILGIFFNNRKCWMTLGSIGIGIGLFVYFCFAERYVYRVEYSIFLGIFLCGLYFWDSREKTKPLFAEEQIGMRLCMILSGLCIAAHIVLYIPDQSYREVTSEERIAYIDDTFYDSGNYDAAKYRKVVNKGRPQNGLLVEIENHQENYYFLDFTTTIQTLYFEWSPWKALPVGYHDNFGYMGGVTTNFPDIVQNLKEKNIENPLQSLVKENIYLVDNYASEVKLNYLREHYYPEARAEVYKEVDGYTIWKFYEK